MNFAEIYEKGSEENIGGINNLLTLLEEESHGEKEGLEEQVKNGMGSAEAKEITSVEESSATADASCDIQTYQPQGSQLDDLLIPNSLLLVEKEGQHNNKNDTAPDEVCFQKALIIVNNGVDDKQQAETKRASSYSFPTHHHVVALLGAFLCLLVAYQVTEIV
jgi:hypothetical protein